MAITEYFVRYLQRRDQLSLSDLERLRAIKTTQAAFKPGDILAPNGGSPLPRFMKRGS